MNEEFLRLENISKSFYGVRALDGVDLTIGKGQIKTLVGQNGSGKSTLIKIIGGVYERDSGDIYINGKRYVKLNPLDSINEGIQIIYQEFALFPNLTVAENIALSQEISDKTKFVKWSKIRNIARNALEKINLDIDLDRRLETISLADRQLIAIAGALLQNAKLIIMDEPTTALTRKEVEKLFSLIYDLKKQGISTLFVSHKLNEIFEISEEIAILRDGKKVFDGDAKELDREKLEFYMMGQSLKKIKPYEGKIKDNQSLMEVKNLTVLGKYRDVSFELYPGEILGITGLLGCGRSELALSLFGLLPVDSGEIFIKNQRVNIDSPIKAIRNGIGYLPDDRIKEGIILEKPISDNIILGIAEEMLNRYKLIDRDKIYSVVEKWIKELNILTSDYDAPAGSLSGGNQQKVALAKWLATEPDVLILNGPTVGIDIGARLQFHQFLREFAQTGKHGVIIISDDISELVMNCSRILLMKDGVIVNSFKQGEITEDELYTKLVSEQLQAVNTI